MMPKRKKTTISDKLVMVKSVRRTRSRRMKFCVQRGLGGIPQQAAPGSRGYPGALIASIMSEGIVGVELTGLFCSENGSKNELDF